MYKQAAKNGRGCEQAIQGIRKCRLRKLACSETGTKCQQNKRLMDGYTVDGVP
jgi:hypothetical protein